MAALLVFALTASCYQSVAPQEDGDSPVGHWYVVTPVAPANAPCITEIEFRRDGTVARVGEDVLLGFREGADAASCTASLTWVPSPVMAGATRMFAVCEAGEEGWVDFRLRPRVGSLDTGLEFELVDTFPREIRWVLSLDDVWRRCPLEAGATCVCSP